MDEKIKQQHALIFEILKSDPESLEAKITECYELNERVRGYTDKVEDRLNESTDLLDKTADILEECSKNNL